MRATGARCATSQRQRVRLAAVLLVSCSTAHAGLLSDLVDPEDGQFDASHWLLERKGFLPIPILITEPAVGYGGGVGLTFFCQSIGEAAARAKETGHVTPPDAFGIGGATAVGCKAGRLRIRPAFPSEDFHVADMGG